LAGWRWTFGILGLLVASICSALAIFTLVEPKRRVGVLKPSKFRTFKEFLTKGACRWACLATIFSLWAQISVGLFRNSFFKGVYPKSIETYRSLKDPLVILATTISITVSVVFIRTLKDRYP
jgi:predicted MFS family arabinose efflux permease